MTFIRTCLKCKLVLVSSSHTHMSHRADEFAILNDGTAAHECVKYRTKFFYNFLRVLVFGVENQRIIRHSTYGEHLWIVKSTCTPEKITLFFHYINVNIPRSSAEMKKTEAV